MKRIAFLTALALACAATLAFAQPAGPAQPAPIPLRLSIAVGEEGNPGGRAFAIAIGAALDKSRTPLQASQDPLAITLHIGALDVAPAGAAVPADVVAYHLILVQVQPDGQGGHLTRYLWSTLGVCSRVLLAKCATEAVADLRPTLVRAGDALAPTGGRF